MGIGDTKIITIVNPHDTSETKKIDFGSPLEDARHPLPEALPELTQDWVKACIEREWSAKSSSSRAARLAAGAVFAEDYALDMSSFLLKTVEVFGNEKKFVIDKRDEDGDKVSISLAAFAGKVLKHTCAVPQHLEWELKRWMYVLKYATSQRSDYIDAANKIQMYLTDLEYSGAPSAPEDVYYDLGLSDISRDEAVVKVLLPLFSTYYEANIKSSVNIFE